jgi:hypothetical protein
LTNRSSPAGEKPDEVRDGLTQRIWRPKAFGYFLLVLGIICVFVLGGAARHGEIWMVFGLGAFGLVAMATGLALIRKGGVARSLRG